MFITSLWTSDRADEFCAVRRRTRVGSPYQVSIIPHFFPVVNTFSKNYIRRLFKILPCFKQKCATMYKTLVSFPDTLKTVCAAGHPMLHPHFYAPFPESGQIAQHMARHFHIVCQTFFQLL